MFSATNTGGCEGTNGFVLQAESSVMLDVADVLGRVGKDAIRSADGAVEFMEVFNCLATLRHAANNHRYIAIEGGDAEIHVTSWDNARLADFMDLIVRDKVERLSANQREKESLRILSVTLRGANDHYH